MKVFWQRWWIVNRLHRYGIRKNGLVWLEQEEFIQYIENIVRSKKNATEIRSPYRWLGEVQDQTNLDVKIRNIIAECADPQEDIQYISKIGPEAGDHDIYLRLNARGRDVYSVYYLIFNKFFGNPYVRGVILTGLSIIVTFYIGNILKKSISEGINNGSSNQVLHEKHHVLFSQSF